ncbi:MAG: glycosyltransferase family 4 protein [Proteobacteria bacterium]|nr:glycosyltransferase family 4 protein [Pseudomonadota bacterium]MCP4919871.1 glycosyltransferase family 4 protein [Pseudomonadota bacterium]
MKVLLIGSGPLPRDEPERLGFPQLRTAWFLETLAEAGHEVVVALMSDAPGEDSWSFRGTPVRVVRIDRADPSHIETVRALRLEVAPDRVVSAGPFEPARVAALTVGDEPLFIDVPGDPFAEAQAKNAHAGERDHTDTMREAWLPAYQRADAFGAISQTQRAALLGQLGMLGRLGENPSEHPWVEILPAVFGFGALPGGMPREREPRSELVVALCGGYNTWLDTDTLLDGLLQAMDEVPGLSVLSTGGGIPGHHTESYDRFRSAALSSPHASRFTFHGWVPHHVLPALLSRAHVGITLDRPGAEAELGTRTRVLFFAQQGLGVIATPCSDLTRELAGIRMLVPVRMGDASGLRGALVRMWEEGDDGTQTARLQGYLTSRYGLEPATRGLREWIDRAVRMRPGHDPAAGLAQELAQVRTRLAEVHDSPTWRASTSARRVLGRIFKKD